MVRNMTSSCAREAAILILRPGRRAPLLAMSPLLLLAALAASVSALPPAPAFLPQPLQDLLNNQDFQQQLQVSCDWSRDDLLNIKDFQNLIQQQLQQQQQAGQLPFPFQLMQGRKVVIKRVH